MFTWPWRLSHTPRAVPGGLVVGADFGLRRIKVVVLARGDERCDLRWVVDRPTPASVFGPDGRVDPVAAGRVLAQLLAEAPASGPLAGALLLPSATLRVRRLRGVSDRIDLKRVLAEDSELRVPGVPVEEMHHAVFALRDTPAGGHGDVGGALVAAAAPREAVRAWTGVGAAADLRPLRLSAPAAALATLHAELHPDELDRPVLLLHIGSVRTELLVVHGGAPLLTLQVVQGLDHLFDRVRAGAATPGCDPEAVLSEGEPSAALEEWVERFRGAHRTAVGAAQRQLRQPLDALPVRVSGGAARFPGVMACLAAALPAAVDVLDPGSRFGGGGDPGADPPGPGLVLALGGALEARAALRPGRADEHGPVMLDLTMPEGRGAGAAPREAAGSLARDPAIWAAMLFALALALGAPGMMHGRLRQGEAALARGREMYRAEAAQVAADSARVSSLRTDSARLAGTLGTLASLDSTRYAWPMLMDAAARALAPYMWLEGLELEPASPGEPSRFRVTGVAPAQEAVTGYGRSLGALIGEGDVGLEGSESLGIGPFPLVGFRVAGSLGGSREDTDRPRPAGPGYNPAPASAVPNSAVIP